MAYNASPSYEHIFYVGGTGISGITDLSMSYSVARTPVNILGGGHIQPVLAEPIQGEISFTRNYIYDDPLIQLTGDYGVDGSLIYASDLSESNGQVIGFTSGYLTNYSISAEVGSIPEVRCTFTVFGQLGSGVRNGELDYSGIHTLPHLCFLNQDNIILSVDQSDSNRITKFSQEYNITRIPVYELKQKTSQNYYAPTQVITQTPVELSTNFTVEIDDYYTANMIDNVRSGVYKSLGVNIKCPLKEGTLDGLLDHNSEFIRDHNNQIIQDDGLGITAYNGNIPASGNLLSESITTSVDGLLAIDLQFRNFI
jgi:hypothetical protein